MDTFIDDEKAAEIQKTFSYNGYQTVRRELFAHLREPQMTIRKDSITFNTACIEGLEDTVYIQILVNQDQKRLVIKKCEKDDRDSLRWCIQKNDKRKSRKITGRQFCNMIYKMMSWDNLCRYKILGHRIDYQGETLYVFELDDAEIFRERPKDAGRTGGNEAEGGKGVEDTFLSGRSGYLWRTCRKTRGQGLFAIVGRICRPAGTTAAKSIMGGYYV